MNLAQAIHERWATSTALEALLPAARFFTGQNADPRPPCAVLSQLEATPAGRFNDGSAMDAVAVRIEVFDGDCQRAAAVLEELRRAFDGVGFALVGGDRVVATRWVNDVRQQQPDGVWHVVVAFECSVLRDG